MRLRVAGDRLGDSPDHPPLHLSHTFEPPAVCSVRVGLAPLGHLRPHLAPRLYPLAPELGRVHAGHRSSLLRQLKTSSSCQETIPSPVPTSLSPKSRRSRKLYKQSKLMC